MNLRPGITIVLLFAALSYLAACDSLAQTTSRSSTPEQEYLVSVRPLLQKFCFECHAGNTVEADVDVSEFATLDDLRKQTAVWVKIRDMLDSRQMPPKGSPHPTEDEHKLLSDWVREFLLAEAKKNAGDPGPVILRRLSNDEYNYSVRDLTGVTTLDPTREFPVDGAAGEGFTNTGSAQSMSPALVTKYLDAAKEVASHAVLTPKGIRFSPTTTRRDHTDELLAQIQSFYRNFTEDSGNTSVTLQGIKLSTSDGGRLPVSRYIEATLQEREAIRNGSISLSKIARQRSLNEKYLTRLWKTLNEKGTSASFPLDGLRRKWATASPKDAASITASIDAAQKSLWKFNSIGQSGREGGATVWQEAASPLSTRQELRHKIPQDVADSEITLWLTIHDLGNGNEDDVVVFDRPRFEFSTSEGSEPLPPIELRQLPTLVSQIESAIASEIPRTTEYLAAVSTLHDSAASVETTAKASKLNSNLLEHWANLLQIGQRTSREITGRFKSRIVKGQGYDAINGWGSSGTPSILTNRSDDPISFLTLTVPARGVTVHPSPTHESVIAWKSPVNADFKLEGLVADADGVCGNGAAWRVELVSESGRSILAQGQIDNGGRQEFHPDSTFAIRANDVVFLIVNARNRNHVCDTTHVELKLTTVEQQPRVWNLATDIVDLILESNPLPDSFGNADTWHFSAQPVSPENSMQPSPVIAGSVLDAFRRAILDGKPEAEQKKLAQTFAETMVVSNVSILSKPDQTQRQQLLDWRGPLGWIEIAASFPAKPLNKVSIDSALFDKHSDGTPLTEKYTSVQAPQTLELRLPAQLVAGAEFVTTCTLRDSPSSQGSVQIQLSASKPASISTSFSLPILVGEKAKPTAETALADFRNLFPEALCYARIVPVDEVVTLKLFYREDDHLKRLMLDETQSAEIDRLWDELYFVAQEPLQLAVSYEQLYEFATQDRPDIVKALEPLREPLNGRADRFRQKLRETEPVHVEAVLQIADRAWRKTLPEQDKDELRQLYRDLRSAGVDHESSIQLTLARILTSPNFLFRHENSHSGSKPSPVTNDELAIRLSYFLWSSLPDDELRHAARDASLSKADTDDSELLRQTRRMLNDPKARRLAIQFACQWLHLRNFDQNNEKNEKLYPEFATLRTDMYEETVRFFDNMFRDNGSMLDLLDADHTFLNEALARHYGIKFQKIQGQEWQRVSGTQAMGRGGIFGMATFLASQSGASRTSPILRGNWVSETLLGEKLPRPPANVPQLPDEVPTGLTARQLIERHSSVPECAKCHERIDPYGFALEQFDVLGRLRPENIDTKTTLATGEKINGISGLREYLLTQRREDVIRQFCRKLLGFALGREIQLSDEPLLTEMHEHLARNNYRFHTAVETIVRSKQFRQIRSSDFTIE